MRLTTRRLRGLPLYHTKLFSIREVEAHVGRLLGRRGA